VVWSVAASFVLFELLFVEGFDLLATRPSLIGDLALSRATSTSKACEAAAGADREELQGTGSLRAAGVGSWQLGLALGFDAAARQRESASAGVLRASAQGIADRAAGLHVPAPPVFVPERFLDAHQEFTTFVEGDPSATAHRLAVLYSPQTCELYKLGAFWGYAAIGRPSGPGERTTHAVEIGYHGRQAGVPGTLLDPMVGRTPRADADRLTVETSALTEAMTKYLGGR
jgi:hypothetical protein